MKKQQILLICISSMLFLSLSVYITPVRGQDYSFDVDSMVSNVHIEQDGSITIEYWINFTCHLGAHPIDIVDIGFPNEHYDLDSVEARMDGNKITDIRKSTVIDIGVEIHLGYLSLGGGESGQLYVKGNNPKMVYEDIEDSNLASVEFSPTWFDSSFCDEYEYLEVNFYFPDGCDDGDEVKYHYDKYDDFSFASDGDLIYTWEKKNAPMQQYMYGVSFPKEYVDSYLPWSQNPQLIMNVVNTLIWISVISLIAGGIYFGYKYFTDYRRRYYPPKKRTNPGDVLGTGILFAFMGFIFFIPIFFILGDILLVILFIIVLLAGFGMLGYLVFKGVSNMRRKYAKPQIKIDSVGVNKELSVVEAAIIRNIPLEKVIFIIMFGLIRKGFIRIVDAEPLKLEVMNDKGLHKLRAHQRKFIKAVKQDGKDKGKLDEKKLKKLLIDLIKYVNRKMSGFKLEKTIRHYDSVIEKAWKVIEESPNKIDWDKMEKQFDWLILDKDFEDRAEKEFTDRYYYHRPYWYNRYYYHRYYWGRRHYSRYHGSSTLPKPPKSDINIYTFADSVIRGVENISNQMVTNFSNFTSRILDAVHPVKKSGYSGGGRSSGGGGSCACACACAGCACACAGGGR